MTPCSEPVELANGQVATIVGVAKVLISIQQYRATIFFKVMDIAKGIDFFLGTDWSKNNCILADYARVGSEPSLLIHKGKTLRIFPNRSPALVPDIAELLTSIISGQQAFSVLTSKHRVGAKPSCIVMVRDIHPDSESSFYRKPNEERWKSK